MAKPNKDSKDPETTETAGTELQDVTVPIEAGAQVAATGEAAAKPVKASIPEHLKKGNRVCAACGATEASYMEKNPRYSLCYGVDVNCYRKGHRVLHGVTMEQVNAKYPDKVGQADSDGNPLISEVSGIGIKPGILIRGAVSYAKKAVDTGVPVVAASGEATGSANTTPVG